MHISNKMTQIWIIIYIMLYIGQYCATVFTYDLLHIHKYYVVTFLFSF